MKTKYWATFVFFGMIFAASLLSPVSSQDATERSVKMIFFFLAVIFLGYGYSLKKMAKKGIKDTKDYDTPEKKQKPIQYILKILFWIMFVLWIVSYSIQTDYITPLLFIFSLSFLMITISTFVISIIHLTRFKDKSFAIMSLFLSSMILIIVFLIGGIMSLSTIYGSDEYTTDELMAYCQGICQDEPEAAYVSVEINPDNQSQYLCSCLDSDNNIIAEYGLS